MRILALETSCDETAAAIVENGVQVLASAVASSVELHVKTGGVIPEVAAREQVKCIMPVINEALSNLGFLSNLNKINALAVTVGPGLIGSLLVGVETAKTLALAWHKPLVPVNHLVGHLYANWIDSSLSLRGVPSKIEGRRSSLKKQTKEIATATSWPRNDSKMFPQFPALCLVVSGGHTDLVLMKNHGQLKDLGGTRDDAAGECFDKSARLLGLNGYFGGPAIAASAEKFKIENLKLKIHLPRPMIKEDNLDFSFSGLKTAVLREVEKLKTNKQFNQLTINHLAYELQEAITDVLVEKVIKAAKDYQPKSILLAGGVAANQRLREKLSFKIKNLKLKIDLFIPPPKLCNDNAIYIASCAFFNYHPVSWPKITAEPGLTIIKGAF